jgi:hypothetical protein
MSLRWMQATGVYLGADRLVAVTVAWSPRGPKVVATERETVDEGSLAGCLQRWGQEKKLRGRMALGIDPRCAFTITRRLGGEEQGVAPSELLASRLGFAADDLVAGYQPVRLPSGPHLALVASRRRSAARLLEGLDTDGKTRHGARLLPVAWALWERASALKRRPRSWKAVIRVLAGSECGIAILGWRDTPIAARLFDAAAGPHQIGLAVLSLVAHAREELGLGEVDGVLLHLGDDGATLQPDCELLYGLTTRCAPACPADPESAATALAAAALKQRFLGVDMFRELRPPPGLKANFPVRTAAGLVLAVLGLGGVLWYEAADLEGETAKLVKQAESNAKKAHVSLKDLPKLHDKLASEVAIAHAFSADRVFWSDVLQALPDVVPDSMELLDLDGRDLINYPSKKKKIEKPGTSSHRSLMFAGEVALPDDSRSPAEVAWMTSALSRSPYFEREFPRITGANVRLLPAVKGLFARVMFTVLPPAHSKG